MSGCIAFPRTVRVVLPYGILPPLELRHSHRKAHTPDAVFSFQATESLE
jgi:hypothetical protein